MKKREQLYYLIKEYSKGQYTIKDFCEVFEEVFFPDKPSNELSPYELTVFEMLASEISRFSPYPEDIRKYPNVYKTEEDVRLAIEAAMNKLL